MGEKYLFSCEASVSLGVETTIECRNIGLVFVFPTPCFGLSEYAFAGASIERIEIENGTTIHCCLFAFLRHFVHDLRTHHIAHKNQIKAQENHRLLRPHTRTTTTKSLPNGMTSTVRLVAR